ncbi:MAG: hypothetical protein LBS57_06915, partial [Treponema sp.]|nr:hypothetical protein [Treponema sp.]
DKDTGYGLGVSELAKPFVEFACFAYSHIDNVDYNPQNVKEFFKEFFDFLADYFLLFLVLSVASGDGEAAPPRNHFADINKMPSAPGAGKTNHE